LRTFDDILQLVRFADRRSFSLQKKIVTWSRFFLYLFFFSSLTL